MIIIKRSEYRYVGYDPADSLYEFKSTRADQTVILKVDKAKVVDKSSNVVIFLKQGGLVEPSHASRSKVSDPVGFLKLCPS